MGKSRKGGSSGEGTSFGFRFVEITEKPPREGQSEIGQQHLNKGADVGDFCFQVMVASVLLLVSQDRECQIKN